MEKNKNLPQHYLAKLLRAVVEFDMIQDDDRILVGVSGGKDSLFLLVLLNALKARIKRRFSLAALTIDPMFTNDFNIDKVADLCRTLEVPYDSFKVDIEGAIKAHDDKHACFTCAYFRRGAINRYAKEHGFNKIAYAHHHDDATETFLMSLIYSGQLTTFAPVTYLSRTSLTVIRPLVYFREHEIVKAAKNLGLQTVKSPCPRDGHTMRQRVKELIADLSRENREFYPHLAAAIRQDSLGELWAPKKSRNEMREVYYDYMSRNDH